MCACVSRFNKLIPLALILTGAPSLARPAEVHIVKDNWDAPLIEIVGEIQAGDTERVKEAAANVILAQTSRDRTSLKFHLNTPGGDVEEAMKLGRYLREILANIESYGRFVVTPDSEDAARSQRDEYSRDYVVLPRDAELQDTDIVRNYSAGIIVFFGAVGRAHRDNSDWRPRGQAGRKPIPVMGIHRPYFSQEFFSGLSPSQAESAYALLENTVRSYMTEMGAPQALIDRMFTIPSDRIDLVPDETFRTYYKEAESFLEEWLIAKCGSKGAQHALDPNEARDFDRIVRSQTTARMNDPESSSKPVFYVYPNPEFPSPYPEQLYERVRQYNFSVDTCRETAVTDHQLEWAQDFIGH